MSPLLNKHWRKPKYVKLYESGGSVYSYYRRAGTEFRIDAEPGTKQWFEKYQEIHSRFENTRIRQGPAAGTLSAAIVAYKESDRFGALAESTRHRYGYRLTALDEKLGDLQIASFTRRSIVQLQTRIAKKKPRDAIEVVKLLNQIFENACDLGELAINPAKEVRKPAGYRAKQFEAWSDDQIATFLTGARSVWRRALTVALYTGLRRGDLVRLTRGHIQDGWIVIDIGKTGGATEIPIHSDLQAELDREMPSSSLMLIPTARGTEMYKDSLSHGLQKECKLLGIEPNPPLHGLRRSAIIRLLQAGCTREEVMAITDQSESMVKHYAGQAHKRVLAENAILKLEDHKRKR